MNAQARALAIVASVAIGVSVVLVFTPLIAGLTGGSRHTTTIAVVDLHALKKVDDRRLSEELADVEADFVVVVRPESPTIQAGLADCEESPVPKSCRALADLREHAVPLEASDDGTDLPNGWENRGQRAPTATFVRTFSASGERDFGTGRAVKTGGVLTFLGAVAVSVLLVRARRQRAAAPGLHQMPPPYQRSGPPTPPPQPHPSAWAQAETPAPAPVATHPVAGTPARHQQPSPRHGARPDQQRGVQAGQHDAQSGQHGAQPGQHHGAQPSAQIGPPPGPLPDEVLAAVPATVTAVTHFGPGGGYVDAGGVLIWAALRRPGEPVHPGSSLSVVQHSQERDALVVSLSVKQEVRP